MKRDVHKAIKKTLSNTHACYVLITCDSPNETGHMNVQMSYEGDSALASYLIHGAQSFFDEEEDQESISC